MSLAPAFRLVGEGEGAQARATAEDLADAAALGPARGAVRLRRRRLLRALAAEVLEAHPDAVRFERLADGRTRILAPRPLYSSVAGRGGWTALAVASDPVGVDVELWPPEPGPPLALLHPLEQAEISASVDPARVFLHFWTAREACLKADGRGLSVAPEQVRAARRDDAVALIEAGRPDRLARLIERGDAIAAIVAFAPTA